MKLRAGVAMHIVHGHRGCLACFCRFPGRPKHVFELHAFRVNCDSVTAMYFVGKRGKGTLTVAVRSMQSSGTWPRTLDDKSVTMSAPPLANSKN